MKRLLGVSLLGLLVAGLGGLSACRREPPSNIDRNVPPETYISRAPAESSLTYYQTRMYWGGADPDGFIVYYEIAVTDSNETPGLGLEEGTGYTKTIRTDSLFTFSTDPPVEQQIIGHRLYVRAVDNEGKIDPTPALAYFVARNDYYPEVVFNQGEGSWTDKCGNPLTRALAGLDTIGVQGFARWSWGGRDRDPGGSIQGYIWKMASQTQYSGGTLADTVAEISFPPFAARRQTLQVRAIDDGGLRSFEDFTRTVILNFDPITLVLDPADTVDGSLTRAYYFLDHGNRWPSGTTLPDSGDYRAVTILYTGYDDARDAGPQCQESGVHRYQGRVASRDNSIGSPAGQPFHNIDGSLPLPAINRQTFFELESGDHFIIIRAVDDYGVVDATPETVVVKVNYTPYVTRLEARPSSSPDAPPIDLLAVRNSSPNHPIEIALPTGDSLDVTVMGRDVHFPDPMNPPPPIEPDPLAAAYDSNQVVAPEFGSLDPENTYKIFFEGVLEPGYEPADSTGGATLRLPVPRPGLYTLIADLQDRTNQNSIGRRGRLVRYLRLRFVLPTQPGAESTTSR